MRYFIFLLFLSNSAFALDHDKNLHLGGSIAISYSASKYFEDSEHPVIYPFALSVALGIAKETNDTVFDRNDLSADVVGSIIGTALANQKYILPSWNDTDKILFQSFVFMNVVDVVQTRKALNSGGRELNPIFGSSPSNSKLIVGKLVGTGIIYYIAENNEENRTAILVLANAIQFLIVRHNYIEIGF